MVQASRFWDKTAEKYAASPISDVPSYERKLEITRSYLRTDMELLEFGCGTGSTALLHAPLVKHIRGIDFSARMIEIARAKAAEAGVANASFDVADITQLDLPEASLDMILGLSVLHLIPEHQPVLERVYRLLKPGGYFVSSTACIGDIMPIFKYVGPLGSALGILPTLNVMRRGDLIGSIERAGFTIATQWQPGPKKAVFIVAQKPAS